MEQETKEQVVYLKDLLFAALYRWRQMLAAGLALALIFGCAVGVSEWKRAARTAPAGENQAAWAEYESQKQLLEKAVADSEKLVENQRAYNLESTLINMDPYSVYRASIELTVQPEVPVEEGADAPACGPYLHAYAVCLTGDRVINAVAEAMGMKSKYLAELITLKEDSQTAQSLSVTVSYPTPEGARQILEMLMDALEEAAPGVSQSVGAHTAHIASGGVNERIDLSILDRQKEASARLDTLRTQLTNARNKLSDLAAPAGSTRPSGKKIAIFAILGGILGAGLVACAAWCGHLAGGRVYSGRVLQNMTHLRVLGKVPVRRWKNPIDRWLRRLEGRASGEDCLNLAAATVRNYCAQGKTLLLVGDCDAAEQQMVAEALNAAGLPCKAMGSLLRSTEALGALPACDAVLLVEQCGVSRYAHILQTLAQVADGGKPLVGCVLLDG